MADQWFYSHDGIKLGPCSARQLKELAASGGLLRTDTVWREGTPQGVLATKVKNLFATTPIEAPGSATAGSSELPAVPPPIASETLLPLPDALTDLAALPRGQQSEELAQAKTPGGSRQGPPQQRKARAVAVKGAVIVSQDGVRVRYRKKCTVCGLEDGCRTTMLIRRGQTRVGFFCPTCRKNRPVVIQGVAQ